MTPGDFNWNHARAFLATAEAGSFSAAAKALQSTQPTVGRQVAVLEAELGVTLFERIGNQLALTPVGHELAEQVRAMNAAAGDLTRLASGRSRALSGLVRLAASESVAGYLLAGAIHRVRLEYPGISLEVIASNAPQDLQRREADIALRNFPPTEADLVARPLRERRAHFYASPGYLAQLGWPTEPAALAKADFFGFPDLERMITVFNRLGIPATAANFPVVCESLGVQHQLCRAGLGICIAMEEVVGNDPLLQRVLPDMPYFPVPMYLTSHRDLRTSRRIRLVFDILAEELGR